MGTYWTKAQRARKKHGPSRKGKRRPKKTNTKTLAAKQAEHKRRSLAAKKAAKTRAKKLAAEHKRRSLAAKKAAKTRAKKKLALAREAKKAKRAAEKLAQEKQAFAEARRKEAKSKKERELDEAERVRRFQEPGRAVGEEFEKTILRQLVPEKERKELTPAQVEKLRKKARKKLRKKFREAIREAERTGEIEAPQGGYDEIRFRDAFKTTGSSINLKIRQEITESVVEEILYRVGEAATKLEAADPRKLWYVTIAISSLGRKLYVGAKIRFKESEDPIARLIMLESFPSTGLWDSIPGALASLRAKLEELVDAETTTLVRYVTIRHFDFKTAAERTEWKRRTREKHAPEETEPPKPPKQERKHRSKRRRKTK